MDMSSESLNQEKERDMRREMLEIFVAFVEEFGIEGHKFSIEINEDENSCLFESAKIGIMDKYDDDYSYCVIVDKPLLLLHGATRQAEVLIKSTKVLKRERQRSKAMEEE